MAKSNSGHAPARTAGLGSPGHRVRWVVITALALGLAVWALFGAGPESPGVRHASAQLGGPVILGGDDLTDHGFISDSTLEDGWLYIRKALENISPQVTRANNGSVAVLGSADSTDTSDDAGAAYHYAAPQAGLTVNFYEGAAAINQFFADLAAGTVTPRIIVTAGTGASNDLDSTEGAALTANAAAIAGFVSSGGGLLSHGDDPDVSYGWLSALIAGLTAPPDCDIPLTLTAAGVAAFPGLTNDDISAGPCHNSFSGDLGGLQVMATDTQNRAAIIGGARVLIVGSPTATPVLFGPDKPAATSTPRPTQTPRPPTATPTRPAATPTPSGAVGPVITAPSTGSGGDMGGSGEGMAAGWLVALAAAAGALGLAGGCWTLLAARRER